MTESYKIYTDMKKELEDDVKEGEAYHTGASFKSEVLTALVIIMEQFFRNMKEALMEGKGFRIVLQYKPEAERAPIIMYREYLNKDEADEQGSRQECQENHN